MLLLALAVFTGCHKPKQPTPEDQLDSICQHLFPADEPGAAVLVIRHDSILFDKGYGMATCSSVPDWSIPGTVEPVGLAVYVVAQSRT